MTRAITADDSWPDSWKLSHSFDRIELWGEQARGGYARMYAERRRQVLAALQRLAPQPSDVLDLAAAQGNFSIAAAQLGHRVTWNDFRGELVDYVKLKSPLAANMRFVPGNILDVASDYLAQFDVVLALEVIEHVAHPDQFLRALATLVRPGGHIILSTPNGGYAMNRLPRFSDCPNPEQFEELQFQPDADGHIFLLHEDEIRSEATKADLEIVEHRLFSNPLTCGHMKTGKLVQILPDSIVRGIEWGSAHLLPRPVSRKVNTASLTVLRRPAAVTGEQH